MNKQSGYFPEFSPSLSDLLPKLRASKVAIWGHIRPDGDCIGSQVALCRFLHSQGVDAFAVNDHAIPYNLRAFIGDTPFVVARNEAVPESDFTITVDCSNLDRIGPRAESLRGKVCLSADHHISNPMFASTNWVDTSAAATAEILAGILLDAGYAMDPITAQALYVGIATDTGHFRYPATSHRVFEICSQLLDFGAKPAEAAHELFERESVGRLRLLTCFLESLQFHLNDQVCVGFITPKMLADTGCDRSETEGFVDYPRCIEQVKIAVFVEEQSDGSLKGSLRSKTPDIRVDLVAAHFGGGGHACAAGFETHLKPDQLVPELISILKSGVAQQPF